MVYNCYLLFDPKEGGMFKGAYFERRFSSKKKCVSYLGETIKEYLTPKDLEEHHIYCVIKKDFNEDEDYEDEPIMFEEITSLKKWGIE